MADGGLSQSSRGAARATLRRQEHTGEHGDGGGANDDHV